MPSGNPKNYLSFSVPVPVSVVTLPTKVHGILKNGNQKPTSIDEYSSVLLVIIS